MEYIVIGVPDKRLTHALTNKLNAIQSNGQIRVVDLLWVKKDVSGAVQTKEIHELAQAEPEVFGNLAPNLAGLLTPQDVQHLAGAVPAGHAALVILFEHSWVIELTQTVREGQGAVFAGGVIPHATLMAVATERAAADDAAAVGKSVGANTRDEKEARHA